jgi:hypothetical protein
VTAIPLLAMAQDFLKSSKKIGISPEKISEG